MFTKNVYIKCYYLILNLWWWEKNWKESTHFNILPMLTKLMLLVSLKYQCSKVWWTSLPTFLTRINIINYIPFTLSTSINLLYQEDMKKHQQYLLGWNDTRNAASRYIERCHCVFWLYRVNTVRKLRLFIEHTLL